MSATDRAANAAVTFLPVVEASDNDGSYAPPCVEIAGVHVYVYLRDGILTVSLDYSTADTSAASPLAIGPGMTVPTDILAGDGWVTSLTG